MDLPFGIGTVVWFVFASSVTLAVSNHQRARLRDRLAAEAVRSELGVRGTAWSFAFLSVSWLPPTRFDLFLTEDRIVTVPSSWWILVGAGAAFHFEEWTMPTVRINAFQPSNWLLSRTVAGEKLVLSGTAGITTSRMTLSVEDPEAWAEAIAMSGTRW